MNREVLFANRWRLAGMAGHLAQRWTGLLLLLYLFLHVRTIHKLSQGPAAFDQAVAFYRHPLFKFGEIGLLAVVIVHAVNGIRMTLHDLSLGHQEHRRWFWRWTVGVAAALFVLGATPMFLFAIWKVGR